MSRASALWHKVLMNPSLIQPFGLQSLNAEKIILTSEWHAKLPFTSQNTQDLGFTCTWQSSVLEINNYCVIYLNQQSRNSKLCLKIASLKPLVMS